MEYTKEIKEAENFGNGTITLHFFFSQKNNDQQYYAMITNMLDDLWETYKETGGGDEFKEFLRRRLGIWQRMYVEGDGRE